MPAGKTEARPRAEKPGLPHKPNGRKVVLIPTARAESIGQCVKSFVENAVTHDYPGQVHFLVADYNTGEVVDENARALRDLKRYLGKNKKRNIHIHHIAPEEQEKMLRELHDKDPERWGELARYVGNYDSTPDGYGPARNRATLLAYSKGLLNRPDDLAILFDDDLYAKPLVRTTAVYTKKGARALFGRGFPKGATRLKGGKIEVEGRLRLKDAGSYFAKIDDYFQKNPKVAAASGGITFDADMPAQDIVDTSLTAIEMFLKNTQGVRRPNSKKMGSIDVVHPRTRETASLGRAVFSRRFMDNLSVRHGFKNMIRKAWQSVEMARPAFTPHWASGAPGIPDKTQLHRGAGNTCVRSWVLMRYPFITSTMRGEDAALYAKLEEDGHMIASTNSWPVAHMRKRTRSSTYANILMEPGEDFKAKGWDESITRIKSMLRRKDAWWASPPYAKDISSLNNLLEHHKRMTTGVMLRPPIAAPADVEPSRMADLQKELRGMHDAGADASELMMRRHEFMMDERDRVAREAAQRATKGGHADTPLHKYILPEYRVAIRPWSRMFGAGERGAGKAAR